MRMIQRLRAMIRAGVVGFKAFLCHSGLDDFPNATEADLRAAMPILAEHERPLIVHAELVDDDHETPGDVKAMQPMASRPAAEDNAIEMLVRLCRETVPNPRRPFRRPALSQSFSGQSRGIAVFGQTCPHYLPSGG